MFVEEYCPRDEVQSLENGLWNLKMIGPNNKSYSTIFNGLALLYPTLVTAEYVQVERYIWGLAPKIKGIAMSSRPTTFESANNIANRLNIRDQSGNHGRKC